MSYSKGYCPNPHCWWRNSRATRVVAVTAAGGPGFAPALESIKLDNLELFQMLPFLLV